MATQQSSLPPEWLRALLLLQQQQAEEQAAQEAALMRAAELQAGPQAGFDARFAGLDEALANAQVRAEQPALPPLAPYGERFLGGQEPYTTGEVIPAQESLPRVNALGRGIKQTPVLGPMMSGVADYLATVGSSQFQPRDAWAAGVDVVPGAKLALKGGAHAGLSALQKAAQWYERRPVRGKAAVEGAWNMGPTNPFERAEDDPVYR